MNRLISWLRLEEISTVLFHAALEALVGSDAKGLRTETAARPTAKRTEEHEPWIQRDLSESEYVDIRREEVRQWILVLLGTTCVGRKELLETVDGYRLNEQRWTELLSKHPIKRECR